MSSRLRSVCEFGKNIFSGCDKVLFCKVYDAELSALKWFNIEENLNREKYVQEIERKIKEEKPKTKVFWLNISISIKA